MGTVGTSFNPRGLLVINLTWKTGCRMGTYIMCEGKTYNDCLDCGKYSSSTSLDYDNYHKEKVSAITCGIGGNRWFK